MKPESKLTLTIITKLINIMPYGMIIANKRGEFIFWNNAAKEVIGNNANSTQNNWVNDFGVYSTDRTRKLDTIELPMSKALNGEICHGDKIFIKNSELPQGIYIKASGFPIMNDEETEIEAAVVVFEDITQEQLLYESVILKINELEQYLKEVLNIDHDEILLKKVQDGQKGK